MDLKLDPDLELTLNDLRWDTDGTWIEARAIVDP